MGCGWWYLGGGVVGGGWWYLGGGVVGGEWWRWWACQEISIEAKKAKSATHCIFIMKLEDLDWSADSLKIVSIFKLLLNICPMIVMVHMFTIISKITCTQNWVQNIMEKMFSYPKIWILWLIWQKIYRFLQLGGRAHPSQAIWHFCTAKVNLESQMSVFHPSVIFFYIECDWMPHLNWSFLMLI